MDFELFLGEKLASELHDILEEGGEVWYFIDDKELERNQELTEAEKVFCKEFCARLSIVGLFWARINQGRRKS